MLHPPPPQVSLQLSPFPTTPPSTSGIRPKSSSGTSCFTWSVSLLFYFFLIKSGIKLNAMHGMQDLSLQPGIKHTPLPMEAWSLNHWTAGGVLEQF